MRTPLFALGIALSLGAWAADPPAGTASAAAAVKQPKLARSPAKPPFLEMEDSGCGGEGLYEDSRCLSAYLGWLDSQLNQAYRRALARLPERDETDNRREREQLRKSQRAWLKYKDDNCALVGGLTGGSNPNVTMFALLCMEAEIKQRLEFLKGVTSGE